MATLGSLISSDEAQEQWALDRRNNKKIDVRQEMLNYLKGLDLDVYIPPCSSGEAAR